MKKIFAVRNFPLNIDLVLFIARIACGYAFILHGLGKVHSPFAWMGPDSAVPGLIQGLAALSEFGGGIALIFGFLTRLAALGLICTMTGAIYFHAVVSGDPFVSSTGGSSYELAVSYLLIAIILVMTGPGRFSLDKKVFGRL